MALLLCPNQLFEHEPIELIRRKGIEEIREIIVWEDPAFFGDRKGSPHGSALLRLNKMRILYMRVATKWYVKYLQNAFAGTGSNSNTSIKVTHVSVDDLWNLSPQKRYQMIENVGRLWIFDPMDHLFMKRLMSNKIIASSITVLDSPQFLLTNREIQEYARHHEGKRLQHSTFFAYVKEKLGILVNVPSMDENNRRPFPKGGKELPTPPFVATNSGQIRGWDRKNQWLQEQQWIERHPIFSKNPGSTEDIGYPYVFSDVRAWFDKFLRERFALFGTYEDAVVPESPWMYHSGIAVFLNMGLLTPKYVIDTLHNPKNRALTKQMNNYEGFLRQLMGWREYSRLYYTVVPPKIYLKNIFGMKKKVLPASWYINQTTRDGKITGKVRYNGKSTGNSFIDDTIKDAWNTGYLHHIRRLMVISNYMTLSEIHPDRAFDWMYEFSMDSWDWVMVFNVYSMGTWSDGGFAMRKPYISSSSYLKKMANMRAGKDSYIWDEKFKHFLVKHKEILKHTQLAKLVKSL